MREFTDKIKNYHHKQSSRVIATNSVSYKNDSIDFQYKMLGWSSDRSYRLSFLVDSLFTTDQNEMR